MTFFRNSAQEKIYGMVTGNQGQNFILGHNGYSKAELQRLQLALVDMILLAFVMKIGFSQILRKAFSGDSCVEDTSYNTLKLLPFWARSQFQRLRQDGLMHSELLIIIALDFISTYKSVTSWLRTL